MSNEWRFQFDNERTVWQGNPRLSAATGGIAIGIALSILALLMAVLVDRRLGIASILGIGIVIWAVRRVQRTEYVITTRSIWAKRGVMRQTVRRVELSKVQNTAYSQSVTGSLFEYGTVTIEIAGGSDLQFQRIDNPEIAREAITSRIGDMSEEIPGSPNQWYSVLQLVRDIRVTIERVFQYDRDLLVKLIMQL